MGKLHTLRRAIERNPHGFMREMPDLRDVIASNPKFKPGAYDFTLLRMRLVCDGAAFRNGQWEATVRGEHTLFPYRQFVRSTLKMMGYDIVK